MDLQLKKLRKQAGYASQTAMAQALNMNARTYASWEREEVGISIEDACRLADFLDCTIDEIAGRMVPASRFGDRRQREMNELFCRLDEPRKDFTLEAMRGLVQATTYARCPYRLTTTNPTVTHN